MGTMNPYERPIREYPKEEKIESLTGVYYESKKKKISERNKMPDLKATSRFISEEVTNMKEGQTRIEPDPAGAFRKVVVMERVERISREALMAEKRKIKMRLHEIEEDLKEISKYEEVQKIEKEKEGKDVKKN
jgi:inosine-uridine nucleoside N-ribohydrolase